MTNGMTSPGAGEAPRVPLRVLGRTGIEVTPVGIGTWAMGSQWGQQDDTDSISALHVALDNGCRSARYGAGVWRWPLANA